MSAAGGFLQGLASGKMAKDERALRERELSIMEMEASRPISPAPGVAQSTGGASSPMGQSVAYTGPISDRVSHAYARLTKEGLPPHVAAGLVGNMMQESGADINPGAVGDNGNAFGSAQWNGPRRHAYNAYAKGRGVEPTNFDAQLDYLLQEGRTTEKSAWEAIQGAKTAEEAALIASQKFWRPGTPHNERRTGYARSVYDRFSQAAPAAAQPAPDQDRSKAQTIMDTVGGAAGTAGTWFKKFLPGDQT